MTTLYIETVERHLLKVDVENEDYSAITLNPAKFLNETGNYLVSDKFPIEVQSARIVSSNEAEELQKPWNELDELYNDIEIIKQDT